MAVQKITNALLYALSTDTKPSSYANNTLCYEIDTGDVYKSTGGIWSIISGSSRTATLSNKTINATNNTITDTSTAAGDILKSNGTKFTRLGRGTANQVLAVNSGGTDIAWTAAVYERVGTATGSANGSTTVFNIAHGLGAAPSYAWVDVYSVLGSNIAFSYAFTDATNIVVTFASAPASGTINFIWRAIP